MSATSHDPSTRASKKKRLSPKVRCVSLWCYSSMILYEFIDIRTRNAGTPYSIVYKEDIAVINLKMKSTHTLCKNNRI